MPRPRKCRRVCRLPENSGFTPMNPAPGREEIILNVDEFETLRLIDREGLSQEECGTYMDVARTTVQQIYTSARKKIADALVEGRSLRIAGGQYRLCEKDEGCSGCPGCWKQVFHRNRNKEDGFMKIAIPLDENQEEVCAVLARAPFFLFSENGKQEILPNPAADAQGGAGLKAAQFLVDQEVDVIITPRCGENSAQVFQAADMKIYKSQGSSAQENLKAFGEEKLEILTHFHAGFQGIQ